MKNKVINYQLSISNKFLINQFSKTGNWKLVTGNCLEGGVVI